MLMIRPAYPAAIRQAAMEHARQAVMSAHARLPAEPALEYRNSATHGEWPRSCNIDHTDSWKLGAVESAGHQIASEITIFRCHVMAQCRED